MQQYHWPVSDLKHLEVKSLGTTAEGYDFVELTGGVRITTDNVVALATTFLGLGTIILNLASVAYGAENVQQELAEIMAGLPFEEPAPEPGPTQLRLIAPDIEGRDV